VDWCLEAVTTVTSWNAKGTDVPGNLFRYAKRVETNPESAATIFLSAKAMGSASMPDAWFTAACVVL
jgi:hypothetical protein